MFPAGRRDPSGPSRGRLVRRVIGAVLLLLVLLFSYQTARTALALRDARSAALELKQQLAGGDSRAATASLDRFAKASHTARSNSDNVLWDLAGHAPLVGRDFETVQVVSSVLDEASVSALPAALKLYSTLRDGDLRSADGGFDLAQITQIEPEVAQMSTALSAGAVRVGRLDPDGLISPLSRATVDIQKQFTTLDSSVAAARKVTALLPPMLGADGPRTYLLMVQNSAEVRATGGLPGSFALLRTNAGKATLQNGQSGIKFPNLDRPVLPLTQPELEMFGPGLGKDYRETNLTPDFARTAQLMRAMYKRAYHHDLDGVISVDPIALSAVLGATGPVTVRGQSLDAGNVVRTLLSDTYARIANPALQDTYFAEAARDVFNGLLFGKLDQQKTLTQLAEAAGRRRLLVWSARPAEQKVIEGTPVAGSLPDDSAGVPHVGLYLNDVTVGKMEYYLRYQGSLESVSCSSDGAQTLRAGLVLRSSAPRGGAGLTEYVIGNGTHAPLGSMRMILRIYSPAGGTITGLQANGAPLKLVTIEEHGRKVAVVDLLLEPSQSLEVSATMRTRPGQRQDPQVQWTPGIESAATSKSASSSCGSS